MGRRTELSLPLLLILSVVTILPNDAFGYVAVDPFNPTVLGNTGCGKLDRTNGRSGSGWDYAWLPCAPPVGWCGDQNFTVCLPGYSNEGNGPEAGRASGGGTSLREFKYGVTGTVWLSLTVQQVGASSAQLVGANSPINCPMPFSLGDLLGHYYLRLGTLTRTGGYFDNCNARWLAKIMFDVGPAGADSIAFWAWNDPCTTPGAPVLPDLMHSEAGLPPPMLAAGGVDVGSGWSGLNISEGSSFDNVRISFEHNGLPALLDEVLDGDRILPVSALPQTCSLFGGVSAVGGMEMQIPAVGAGARILPTGLGPEPTTLSFGLHRVPRAELAYFVRSYVDPGKANFTIPGEPAYLWRLSASGTLVGPITVTLHYDGNLFPPHFDEATLQASRYYNGRWEHMQRISIDTASNLITFLTPGVGTFALGIRNAIGGPRDIVHMEASPTDVGANLKFSAPAEEHVTIELLDLQGRRVRDVFRGSIGPEERSATIDARPLRLPHGIYFARIAGASFPPKSVKLVF